MNRRLLLTSLSSAITFFFVLVGAANAQSSLLHDSRSERGGEETPFLLGGIQANEQDHQRWMAALHQAGMNTVQATVYAHQGPWNTSKLWYSEEEPSVLAEVQTARANGLQVALILRVALDHSYPENRFLWHGLVYPQTEEETRAWFRTYTDFVLKWARIAERESVEVLGIGSEMNALAATLPVDEIPGLARYYLDEVSQERLRRLVGRLEPQFTEEVRVSMGAGDFVSLDDFLVRRNQAEQVWAKTYTFDGAEDPIAAIQKRRRLLEACWRELVEKVRKVFSGRLTFAANYDNYHEVAFWDVLDFIGVNAYFELRVDLEPPPTEKILADGWRKVFADISAFREGQGLSQKVLLTELGYTRRRGTSVAPWSSRGFIPLWDRAGEPENDDGFFWELQPIEPEERALALAALHQVYMEGRTGLGGLLYWKLASRPDLLPIEPFLIPLGTSDPALDALDLFAQGIRPWSPLRLSDPHAQAVDAILREDLPALRQLGSKILDPAHPPLLHLAVRQGHKAMVDYLLALGARVDQRDDAGLLPLHWACYSSHPELVEELLPPAAAPWQDDLGETPLMKCARLDQEPVARQLLQQGDRISAQNSFGQTALHLAADQASVPMIELLLQGGADADALDQHGMTPLHLAARRGEVEAVRALAKKGQGKPNLEKNRPASEAAIHGRGEAFSLLFDPSTARQINVYGQSLLHLAAHGGDLSILKTVLPSFSEVDLVDHDGWTPLAFATRNGQAEAVELLLSRGASIVHRNLEGTAPLHLAGAGYEPRLLQQFVLREIDLDLPDGDGNTALHHAAGWGHVENLRILLAAGARTDLRNKDDETPLELAERYEKLRVVQILRGLSTAQRASVQVP